MAGAPDISLLDAARRGDAAAVEHLLRQGGDAGARDADGRTALHHAVAGAHAQAAAALLAYGADHDRRDRSGRRALEPHALDVEVLHAIRQRYHRFRRGDAGPSADRPGVESWTRELDRCGIVRIPGLIAPDELTRMRWEFEEFVRALGRRVARGEGRKRHYFEEEHWWPAERAFVSNNAFRHSPQLARFVCRPDVLAAARRYLGRPPLIQRAVAMRYLPGATAERDMFAWHHDLEDRRLKIMVLLSDVGTGDQHLSYVCGSHALFHPYRMFLQNGCGLEYCRERLGGLEIYDALGAAGDVFLFDSNGAHRGQRRATGRVRDVFLVELTGSAANLWGGDLDASVLEALRPLPDPFVRFLAVEKKWNAPRPDSPTWAATLADVRTWL